MDKVQKRKIVSGSHTQSSKPYSIKPSNDLNDPLGGWFIRFFTKSLKKAFGSFWHDCGVSPGTSQCDEQPPTPFTWLHTSQLYPISESENCLLGIRFQECQHLEECNHHIKCSNSGCVQLLFCATIIQMYKLFWSWMRYFEEK